MPDFVIIGAQKAATTSLWNLLNQHPEIAMSERKETDFFVEELNWRQGLEWYESQFRAARMVGEASPNYSMHPALAGVPRRMARVVPKARLVYVLRHPIDRMISAYLHGLSRGYETLSIDRALIEKGHYLAASSYALQLDQYLRHFDRSQILVLTVDELDRNFFGVLDRLMAFLGLESGWRPAEAGRLNTSAEKRVPRDWWRRVGDWVIRTDAQVRIPRVIAGSPITTRSLTTRDRTISPATKVRLEKSLRPDIARLPSFLGEDFDGWGLL